MSKNKLNIVTFKESNVHQGHYVYINGEDTGILVNLFAYETITDYKAEIDKKIKQKLKGDKKMRIIKTKSTKENLCKYCSNDFATCPKANHIVFGDGVGNDNVIECSEFSPISYFNNYPIEGTDRFAKRVDLNAIQGGNK